MRLTTNKFGGIVTNQFVFIEVNYISDKQGLNTSELDLRTFDLILPARGIGLLYSNTIFDNIKLIIFTRNCTQYIIVITKNFGANFLL